MTRHPEPGRPRLLFVINETYFFVSHRLALAQAALAEGYEVHIAAPNDHVWAPADFEVDFLRQQGLTYHELPLSRRGTNPLQELRTLAALWRLVRVLRPDLIHLLTIKPVLYGGLVARILRVPARVATMTGLGQAFVARGPRAAVLRRLITMAYKLALGGPAMRVIFQNPDDRDRLLRAGALPARRAALIRGSGFDPDRFQPGPDADGPVLAVMAARLIWEKGVDTFHAAARRVRAERPDIRFALIGDTQDSNPRAVPPDEIEAWQAAGDLEWWGRREDMPDIFRRAHIVCLPSRYGEGVPKVLIEAAAAGRAIVASDIAGCREIARHEDTALLVPPGDDAALAAAILRLADDRDLRRRLGEAGARLARECFSENQVVRATLQVYRELGAMP